MTIRLLLAVAISLVAGLEPSEARVAAARFAEGRWWAGGSCGIASLDNPWAACEDCEERWSAAGEWRWLAEKW